MRELLEEALKLPIGERIRIADALYSSVGDPPGSSPLTDAQIAELERRIKDYEKNPDGNLAWEDVKDAPLAR